MFYRTISQFNPELGRLARTNLSLRRMIIVALILSGLAFFVGFMQWTDVRDSARYWGEERAMAQFYFANKYFNFIAFLMGAMMFVIAPAASALSFVQERLRGTQILQQTTFLSPFKLTLGKFLGSGLLSYLAFLILTPFLLYAHSLSDKPYDYLLAWLAFLLIGGLCAQAVALFLSAHLSGSETHSRGAFLLIPVVSGVCGVLGIAASDSFFRPRTALYVRGKYIQDAIFNTSDLFGIALDRRIVLLSLAIFIGGWAFVAAVRCVRFNQLLSVSAAPVWAFIVSAEILLCGMLWGHGESLLFSRAEAQDKLMFYLAVNLIAIALYVTVSALTRDNARECRSAGDDPYALLQRREIRQTVLTFMLAATVSVGGICALWFSYHVNVTLPANYLSLPDNFTFMPQLLPIIGVYLLSLIGCCALIQSGAFLRFRWGAYSGLAFAAGFFVLTAVGGSFVDNRNNIFALTNPLNFIQKISEKDLYLQPLPVDQYELKEIFHLPQHYWELLPDEVRTATATEEGLQKIQRERCKNLIPIKAVAQLGLTANAAFALIWLLLLLFSWRRLFAADKISSAKTPNAAVV